MGTIRILKKDEDPDYLYLDDSFRIKEGGSLKIKNHMGFTVAEITENGDIKRKGRDVKI